MRILAMHDVYLILNDWIGLGYLIYLLCTISNFLPLVHSIILIWAFQLLVFQVFTTVRLYAGRLYVPPEVVVFFSAYKVCAGRLPQAPFPRLLAGCQPSQQPQLVLTSATAHSHARVRAPRR